MGDAKRRKEAGSFGKKNDDQTPLWVDISGKQAATEKLPPGVTMEDFLRFLESQWEIIGATAYAGFVEHGRGFLVVDWNNQLTDIQDFRDVIKFPELPCPIIYFGKQGPLNSYIAFEDPNVQRLITNYTPETSVVLAIYWLANGEVDVAFKTLALAGRPTPATLYIEQADKLVEVGRYGDGSPMKPFLPEPIRKIQVHLFSDNHLLSTLRANFITGWSTVGAGTLLCIPKEDNSVMAFFIPVMELQQALGCTPISPGYLNALEHIRSCNPESQMALLCLDRDVYAHPNDDFDFYSLLISPES